MPEKRHCWGQKMLKHKVTLNIIFVILTFASFKALAGSGSPFSLPSASSYDPSASLEASAGCLDCIDQTVLEQKSLSNISQLKLAHIFDNSDACAKSGKCKDPRVKFTQDGEEGRIFAPIGRITPNQDIKDPATKEWIRGAKGNVFGTAFLVSPCHIVANYHAVYGIEPTWDREYSATFYVGKNPEKGGAHYEVQAYPIIADNPYDRGDSAHQKDWVLLETKPCAGSHPEIGWMELDPVAHDANTPFKASIAGFYGDLGHKNLKGQNNCDVVAFDYALGWIHNCAAFDGASGSPIFRMVNGIPKVVGMNAAEFGGEVGSSQVKPFDEKKHGSNVAVNLNEIRRDIDPYIQPAIQAYHAVRGQLNPSQEFVSRSGKARNQVAIVSK